MQGIPIQFVNCLYSLTERKNLSEGPLWVDKAYPRGGHGLLSENLSVLCGTLPYKVLVREAPEASKAAQPITIGLGLSSWRVGKTLLLKT